MSQTPSESGKVQSPSLLSLNPDPQQGPPPSVSRTSDKREDTSSMKSTKRSLRSRIPFFWKKGSTTSLPEEPLPPSSPAPSSHSESSEYLSSSGLTAKPTMSTDPTLPPILTSREAAAREELARLTAENDELERTIVRDRTITQFYQRASRPQLEGEPAAQYWQRQTATRVEADAINEAETEAYRQRPLHEPVWLERYRQYRALQIRQELPGVSLATWMEARAHTGYHNPRESRARLYEYLAFQESAYPNRSDLDAFGGGSGMDASGSS
ncbi:hypothetical protein EV421DRAFT_1736184 [Armillaria borealis]|uniref:Uncharacterized protein n=1 Tax=Armillaria borealis TaxID=47425 RepID=A0AA39MR17_9AGAR|nr:hypothetical protein EV421DRAFT_1736184 [Armillaria borealis]